MLRKQLKWVAPGASWQALCHICYTERETQGADLVRACSQFLTYLDRSSLAFTAPQMLSDLRLDGATYGLGAGLLFVTYSVLMVPGSLLVEMLGAPNGLALAMVAWGLVTALTSLVRGAPSLFAARLALGAAEACCFPGAHLLVHSDRTNHGQLEAKHASVSGPGWRSKQ